VVVGRTGALPARVGRVLGWAGLAAVGYAAASFDAATSFPGSAALVPTLGAAAVLLAGSGDGAGEVRVLTAGPMQTIGGLSYSLYLWHWPLLVVATALWAGEDRTLGVPVALAVVAVSAVPAWITYRTVEQPFHRSRRLAVPWRAGVLAAVCVAVGLASAGAVAWSAGRAATPADDAAPGAAALGDDPATTAQPADRVSALTPPLADAPDDVADVYADGCHQDATSPEVTSCIYGDAESDTVVALVGDSHAAHWQPALTELAEQHGWRLETYTKSSCPFADVLLWEARNDRPYTDCQEWQAEVRERLAADPPGAVVVSSADHEASDGSEPLGTEESREALADGMARSWRALEEAGSEVLAIVDTPWLGINAPECVAEHLDDLRACAVPREEAVERSGAEALAAAAERVPVVNVVDLTEFVCPAEECVPVVGGVLTHSDAHHLTATYSRTLAPRLEGPLTALLR